MEILRIFKVSLVCFACLYTMQGQIALAQMRIVPIEASADYNYSYGIHNARTLAEDSTQIILPFWDDFSTAVYDPDTAKWMVGSGTAVVSAGAGIDPPTVQVAVFDGWNRLGVPYSTTQLEQGAGDSLVSRFIDLSQIAAQDTASVFFSFFWQKEGRGEQPDMLDSIALFFMNKEKEYVRVWGRKGESVEQTDRFFQEIIKVEQPYFDPYFRFKFQSYGRLSGGFDSWYIDYVYMNYGRNPADTAYQDRALTSPPGSFLKGYTAMPYDHFILDINDNLQPVTVGFYNLDRLVQPIEFSALIRDSTGIFDQMNELTVLDPNPGGFERRTILSNPIDPGVFDTQHDTLSLTLETVFYINSGDSVLFDNAVDYRVNDTTVSVVLLDRVLAYDDGSAEWAAGLSQSGTKLAYRFVASRPDIITDVNFYFPSFSSGNAGRTLTLIIWDNLREGVEGRLLTEQHIIQASDSLNQYRTYRLGRPVSVQDTFYIGYEQEFNDFFAVGLDKNTDSGDHVFINTGGAWAQNEKISGSLMIRPVFGFKKAVGLNDGLFDDLHVYPNPSDGLIHVEGGYAMINVIDIVGRDCTDKVNRLSESIWDARGLPAGVYIAVLKRGHVVRTTRIVLLR